MRQRLTPPKSGCRRAASLPSQQKRDGPDRSEGAECEPERNPGTSLRVGSRAT
jgi:hypothetical protein